MAVGRRGIVEMLTQQRRKRFQKKYVIFCCKFIEFPLHLNYYKSITQKEYFRTKRDIF